MICVTKGREVFSSLYGFEENLEKEEVLRISLMYIFTCCGILFLLINSVIAFTLDSKFYGILDLLVALVFCILVIWPKKQSLTPFIIIGVLVVSILYLFLFATGGSDSRGFVWSYTFPLFTFFLFGCRKGLIINGIFFVCCLLIINYDTFIAASGLYDLRFGFRFTFSFLNVVLFSFTYECFRERSAKAYQDVAMNLESTVVQRTKNLADEIEKKEKLNRKLISAKNEWVRTFDAVPANISIVDADYNIVRVHKSMAQRVGLTFDQIIGEKCYDIVEKSVHPSMVCPQSDMLNHPQEYSKEIYDKSTGKYYFLTVSPLYDEEGVFYGAVHVAYDISEQKGAEEERAEALEKLRKSEKMEMVGQIAGGVAHDLNNILSGVVTYPELLLHTTSPENPLYQPLVAIKESGKRASAVVSDLLTIVRGVSTTKNVTSLNGVLEEYFSSLEFKNLVKLYPNVIVDIELSNIPIYIKCNPIHIQKVIMNLITNAIEAVNTNGRVGVIVRPPQNAESQSEANTCEIEIKDDGHGIDIEDQKNIFEPFYSRKNVGRSGTGLGLSIVKNIIEDHQAVINVESDSSGTTFLIQIATCELEAEEFVEEFDISTLKGTGNVLLVDDEIDQIKVSGKMLEFLGYEVVAKNSGEDALEYFQSECADLVLLDIQMKQGIDGIETYQRIISSYPHQKTVLTSGYMTHEMEQQAKNMGVNAVLKKPYTIRRLGQTIQNTLAAE